MKGLLRKDLYLMIKYCRLFFILIIVFSFAGAWNNNLFFALYPITISSIIPVNLPVPFPVAEKKLYPPNIF